LGGTWAFIERVLGLLDKSLGLEEALIV
jgi:hypothetical protein